MGKSLFIAEKPSVAREFAAVLKVKGSAGKGYMESGDIIVTWCVGHLITMSYPAAYDAKYRRWSLETLPFIPEEFRYEVIEGVKGQFDIVRGLLLREDVTRIYVCTDAGREGEYIYRLVEQMAGVKGKIRKRVWIDSQTEDEIKRGIREAKDLSCYDNLAASAYLRAKEDYLMGINFSRLLTLKYGPELSAFLKKEKSTVISVGRVMTCVLGMVVRREREIRSFVKLPFYKVLTTLVPGNEDDTITLPAEWRVTQDSAHFEKPYLYKENGFRERNVAQKMADLLAARQPSELLVKDISKKQEKKYAPLLFNLAELQNSCAKLFKISPDETLKIAQELYEKKMITYPRTDARVLSSAIAGEIHKNIAGLKSLSFAAPYCEEILAKGLHKSIGRSRYTNDKKVTDHYAILPTGQGTGAAAGLKGVRAGVYELIVRRFLSIFYPPAVYQVVRLETAAESEHFFSSVRVLKEPGFLAVAGTGKAAGQPGENGEEPEMPASEALLSLLARLRKGMTLPARDFTVKEGETSPPAKYTSGSIILAMENAGQLIEDEDLRAQIKGSGIGTSATRAEILKKLFTIQYMKLNEKTQVISPTLLGEMIYDTVDCSIRSLLNAELTASWELGLTRVADGSITDEEYMEKLSGFIVRRTHSVLSANHRLPLRAAYERAAGYYRTEKGAGKKGKSNDA